MFLPLLNKYLPWAFWGVVLASVICLFESVVGDLMERAPHSKFECTRRVQAVAHVFESKRDAALYYNNTRALHDLLNNAISAVQTLESLKPTCLSYFETTNTLNTFDTYEQSILATRDLVSSIYAEARALKTDPR